MAKESALEFERVGHGRHVKGGAGDVCGAGLETLVKRLFALVLWPDPTTLALPTLASTQATAKVDIILSYKREGGEKYQFLNKV